MRRIRAIISEGPALVGAAYWRVWLGHVGMPSRISFGAEFIGPRRNIHIGAGTLVAARACFDSRDGGSIHLGRHCEIHPYARLLTYGGDIRLGDYCSVNPYSMLYGHGGLEI